MAMEKFQVADVRVLELAPKPHTMRIELRDHRHPCEHPYSLEVPEPGEDGYGDGFRTPRGGYEEYDDCDSTRPPLYLCGEPGCPGGARRVFEKKPRPSFRLCDGWPVMAGVGLYAIESSHSAASTQDDAQNYAQFWQEIASPFPVDAVFADNAIDETWDLVGNAYPDLHDEWVH